METCRDCGGTARVIACIEDPVVIKTILAHLERMASLGFYPPNRKIFYLFGLHKKLRIPLEKDLATQAEVFLCLNAQVIYTRPSSLVELIGYFKSKNIKSHLVKLVFSHSEPLLEPHRKAGPGIAVPEEDIINESHGKYENIPVTIHYADDFHLSADEKFAPFVSEIN